VENRAGDAYYTNGNGAGDQSKSMVVASHLNGDKQQSSTNLQHISEREPDGMYLSLYYPSLVLLHGL